MVFLDGVEPMLHIDGVNETLYVFSRNAAREEERTNRTMGNTSTFAKLGTCATKRRRYVQIQKTLNRSFAKILLCIDGSIMIK